MIHGPKVVNGLPAMGHDDQSAFPTEVVDKELEEGVDGESLGMSDRKGCSFGIRCTS